MAAGEITNVGKNVYLARAFGLSSAAASVFSVGTGTTDPTATDTAMQTAVNINGSTTKTFISGSTSMDTSNIQVEFRGFVDSGEANGNTLTEAGVLNTDSQLFMRDTFTAFSKDSTGEITFIWKNRIS